VTVQVEHGRAAAVDPPALSVVVPLAAHEPPPEGLIGSLPADMEVILARGGTRAEALNAGAAAARGAVLWFLHADTRLPEGAVEALGAAIRREPRALLFFDLAFDGPAVMALNATGARFRSRLLRLPFGDQALCLDAGLFRQLGGYPAVPRGEDHLLVWRAHRAGVPVRPVGASVTTSSRRYRARGWARTTALHLALTLRQAAPEVLAWLRGR
jgi:hypothetical protein